MADAARNVLEHTARLSTTNTWERLCAQVKGLTELTQAQQRQALKSASRSPSRAAPPLAALITSGSWRPNPLADRPPPERRATGGVGAGTTERTGRTTGAGVAAH